MSLPRTQTALLLALASVGASVPSALAVDAPPAGSYGFTWKKADCFDTTDGFRKIASIRTEVRGVPDRSSFYYQEVKVQIDRQAGFSDASPTWREVAHRVYDWSRFRAQDLTAASTSSVRTGLGEDAATYTAKATVWLKRVRSGPDETVWRYRARSARFFCGGTPVLG